MKNKKIIKKINKLSKKIDYLVEVLEGGFEFCGCMDSDEEEIAPAVEEVTPAPAEVKE